MPSPKRARLFFFVALKKHSSLFIVFVFHFLLLLAVGRSCGTIDARKCGFDAQGPEVVACACFYFFFLQLTLQIFLQVETLGAENVNLQARLAVYEGKQQQGAAAPSSSAASSQGVKATLLVCGCCCCCFLAVMCFSLTMPFILPLRVYLTSQVVLFACALVAQMHHSGLTGGGSSGGGGRIGPSMPFEHAPQMSAIDAEQAAEAVVPTLDQQKLHFEPFLFPICFCFLRVYSPIVAIQSTMQNWFARTSNLEHRTAAAVTAAACCRG